MTYEIAKSIICCCNIEVIKFNLAVNASFLDMYDLEQLLNELMLVYHSGLDGHLSTHQQTSEWFSDDILDAVCVLIDDADYGIFKDCMHSNELVDMLKFIKSKAKLCAHSHYEDAIDLVLQHAENKLLKNNENDIQ